MAEGWIEVAPRRAFRVCVDLPVSRSPSLEAGRRRAENRCARGVAVRSGRAGSRLSGPEERALRLALGDARILGSCRGTSCAPRTRASSGRATSTISISATNAVYPASCGRYATSCDERADWRDAEIMLTHGLQEAIALVAQGMLGEGDTVAVGDPGFPPAWDAFRAAGARLVPIPVDDQGLDVDALGRALQQSRCRLVYVTPGRHYPTTASLSASRRLALLEESRAAPVFRFSRMTTTTSIIFGRVHRRPWPSARHT